ERGAWFHHQAEAQHPNFELSVSWQADYPIFWAKADIRQPVGCVGMTRLTQTGHRRRWNPATQRTCCAPAFRKPPRSRGHDVAFKKSWRRARIRQLLSGASTLAFTQSLQRTNWRA